MKHFRRFAPASAVLVACLLASGCQSSARIASSRPVGDVVSPKLSPFVHFEDGATLFIGVDVRAAQYVKDDEKVFPLGIGLANQSRGSLTFNRESFVLETAARERYPVVSVREFNEQYTRSSTDLRLADTFLENLAFRFANYNFVQRSFFPYRGTPTTATNSFELGRLFWTHLYLYFPVPEDGLHGKEFNLLVDADEVEETFVVRFTVK